MRCHAQRHKIVHYSYGDIGDVIGALQKDKNREILPNLDNDNQNNLFCVSAHGKRMTS